MDDTEDHNENNESEESDATMQVITQTTLWRRAVEQTWNRIDMTH